MEQVRLFFSHSSKDDEFGRRLVGDLRAHLGEDSVWYDVSGGLHGGDEWWNRIVAEITARDTFLVLFSPDALTSDWVPREMGIAYWQHVKLGKRLMPLMHRTCEMPADWQLIQALPFTDDLSYNERLTVLLRELGYTGPIKTISLTAQPALASAVARPATLDITNTPTTPRERLVARLTQEVHTAFGRENWSQALLRARTVQEEAPEAMTPQLWREQGLAALALKDSATALAALEHALAADPYDAPTLRSKALALALQNKRDEAIQLLKRAETYIPMDEKEPQLALLGELIELLRQRDKWDETRTTCDQALALDPSSVVALANKANALGFLKRTDEALATCERAIALDPNSALVWSYRANIYYNASRFVDALSAYEHSIALDPTFAPPWNGKGNALYDLKRFTQALPAFEESLRLNPTYVTAWNNKGYMLATLKRYDDALVAYDQALALDPTYVRAWWNKVDALNALGRSAEAKEAERQAQALEKQV